MYPPGVRSCNHDTGGGGSSAALCGGGILHEMTGKSGNGGNGGPDCDDSSTGENGGTGESSARLARPARLVLVHTVHRCTTGFGGAAVAHPHDNPAPEGATGLAGANLHIP